MQFQQLRYFISLVEKHSFTDAARECCITQSALSQQVKSLESEVEVDLLKRKGKTFEITPAGHYLYQKALLIMQDIAALAPQVQRVGNNEGHSLRLGILASMDHNNFEGVFKDKILKQTGFDLFLRYGSHHELHNAFLQHEINAFISEERLAHEVENCNKIKLFSTKMYIELPKKHEIPHTGIKKFKVESVNLKELTLLYICDEKYHAQEQALLSELLKIDCSLQCVKNLETGRRLALKQNNCALLIDRSLMRGDNSLDDRLTRYEILHNAKAIKRHLCCFCRESIKHDDLNELYHSLMSIGTKDYVANSSVRFFEDGTQNQYYLKQNSSLPQT